MKKIDYDWREDNLMCNDCRYFCLIADKFPEKNRCPNMDYTKYWFYAPYFTAHCTGEHSNICRHFKPSSVCKWLSERFTSADDYMLYQIRNDEHNRLINSKVAFFKAGDRKTEAFHIRYLDFYFGQYLDKTGNLKAVDKFYYKNDRSRSAGTMLVTEWLGLDEYTDYMSLFCKD